MATNNGINNIITATATDGAVPLWDSNKNLSGNSLIPGSTTTVRSISGVYTLTASSAEVQIFTGNASGGSDELLMPLTSTLVAGQAYLIINTSTTDTLFVFDSTVTNIIAQISPSTSLWMTCILNSGATVSSWSLAVLSPSNASVTTTGSWTPTLTAATPGTLSVAYTTQTGTYIKWTTAGGASFVSIYCSLTCTATNGTASGDMRITGLPFTANNNGSSTTPSQCSANWTWGTGLTMLAFYIAQSPIAVRIAKMGTASAGSTMAITDITSATSNIYRFQMTYAI
jgi:hypothetical protein